MRPLRSFLLLLIFLACFTGLHYVIPANQLFPSIYEFIPSDLISGSFSDDKTLSKTDTEKVTEPRKIISADSIIPVDSIHVKSENFLSYPLQGFLDSLRYSRGQLRIMYYGDSQIEGDRITSFLRQSLRKGHGGTGPGLFLPLMPVMYTKSVWLRSSSNWKKFNYISFKARAVSHRNLGPFMAICRYLPDGARTKVPEKAFVRIRPSKVADSTSSVYDILRVFYGNTEDTVNIVVKADDNEVFADTLKRGMGFNEITCPLKGAREILIEFTGKVSPDIYGISIESKSGVIVDNIPQRGSAGLEFTMVGMDNLKEAYKRLSPSLIILQYGLNIVKNVRGDYSYYQKGLGRQLSLIKEISPLTPILVISVTDMAVNKGDSIKSYKNIPAIIEAQKRATLEAGVTFWDSYRAMGGESSIIKWVRKKPPLAQKDYVHFTYTGADTLSKKLADALFPIRKIDTIGLKYISIRADTIYTTKSLSVAESLTDGEENSIFRSVISSLFRYNPDEPLIFSIPAFWLFFLVVLAGYSLVYKKSVLRNSYLFLVSLFFYYKSGGLFLFLLIFVTLIDFTCGLLIHHSRTKFMRRLFILFSIISNIGILAYFKYTGFFVDTINHLLGTDYRVHDFLAAFSNSNLGTSFNISNIILPVGISFFTFQSLSYTIDVYRKKLAPVRNIIDFGFYVSFFPQLVAGPIVRASEFIPQLYKEFHLSKREFSYALFLISKGLIKKIIISDFIAINFVDRVFDAPSIYSGFENLMAIYGYGLQIYCDFSGYTDIAIGLALILGFRLPVNFNSPYKAAGIADFWKRWHISLSRWLKDYLYIPLGGNRKGKIRTNINLIITMLLGGLWHGAALRFVIWGALHGIGLVINSIWNSIFGDRLKKGLIGRAIAVFITFQFVSFCWIFFRAPDMDSVNIMVKQIFNNFSPGSYMTVLLVYSNIFLLMAVGYIIHFLPERVKESYRGLFIRIPLMVQLIVIMLVAVLLFQMRSAEVMPFIYFRF
ncbi:MAG: MBOAT family O-acyltransferase [Bacteroidota bacterium]